MRGGRMCVCVVSGIYPPRIGGPSGQTYYLCQFLLKRGILPVVVTLGEENSKTIADGVEVHYVKEYKGIPGISLGLRYAAMFWRLMRLVKWHRVDVIHFQTGVSYIGWVVGAVAHLTGTPSLIKFAGDLVLEQMNRNRLVPASREGLYRCCVKARLLARVQKGILLSFDRIWAPSSYQLHSLVNLMRVPAGKVASFPNLQKLHYVPSRNRRDISKQARILSVTRFVAWKGIDDLIRIVHHASDSCDISWTIVGGGMPDIAAKAKNLVEELGLADKVVFAGEVSPVKIGDYYRQADIFLHTTYNKWFGLVFLEAMSAGLPVVALNIGENGEIPEQIPSGS